MTDADLIQQLFDNFSNNRFVGLQANSTPQELAAHDPTGNPQPQGWIADGAVDNVAAFAATIRPVILVTALPTLPDPDYPEGQFVYKTNDSPPRLYKNVSGSWVAGVGPDDIQANSITAGQIAAGAVSTSELAVGARLTGEVANEAGVSPGVFIDSSGLLVRSGKLTLQDEFGATVMVSSGFSGTWSEFIHSGLYNGAFLSGTPGTISNGRTSKLPYWTVSDVAGTPTLTFEDPTIRCKWAAVNTTKQIESDIISVLPGTSIETAITVYANIFAGDIQVEVEVIVWEETLTSSVGLIVIDETIPSSTFSAETYRAFATIPTFGYYYQVQVRLTERVAHNAANEIFVYQVAARPGTAPNFGAITHAGAFSANPTPILNEIRYRSDMGMWVTWDGTRWICTCPHVGSFTAHAAVSPISATTSAFQWLALPVSMGKEIAVRDIECAFRVDSGGSALSGSHKWVADIRTVPDGTLLTTLTIDSGSSNSYRTISFNAAVDVLTSADVAIIVNWTKTGTPGDLRAAVTATYYFIADEA